MPAEKFWLQIWIYIEKYIDLTKKTLIFGYVHKVKVYQYFY